MRTETEMDDGSAWFALAEVDLMCCEYVSSQLVSIPRSIRLSTNGMFLSSSVKAGQSRAGPRWRCWDFEWLIESRQPLDIENGVGLSKDVYSFKSSADNFKDASPSNSVSRSLINKIKRIGQRTEPWDAPLTAAEDWDETRSTATRCDLFARKVDIHDVRLCGRPYEVWAYTTVQREQQNQMLSENLYTGHLPGGFCFRELTSCKSLRADWWL